MEARQDEFIDDATSMSSKSFANKVHRWERLIDEDGPEPANERNHKNRDAKLRPNPFELSWDLTGFFGSVQGAQMREILDRYIDAEFRADCASAKAADMAVGGNGDITRADLDRTDAQRRADALYRIFQDAATAPDGAVPPGFVHNIHWSATAFEEMLAAMDADRPPRLHPDTFMCRTDDGHDLDPTEAAATSLFSQFRRIVVNAAGVVIDLGRARRFTGSARAAATATHTHCIWPGCHAPAGRCDVDHLTEHSRNGPTNPANAAPLCGRHNRWKQKGYAIRRLPDGSWHTTRPDGSQLE
ncbi:MAG: HNH endonuclease signature motif containing protein [Microthrixaceae bacterium]